MSDLVKAKNISGRVLNLASGAVQPNSECECTKAELSTLSEYLEPVPEKPVTSKK